MPTRRSWNGWRRTSFLSSVPSPRVHRADSGAAPPALCRLRRVRGITNTEFAEAESRLATDGEYLKQAKQILDLALDLAKDCASSYRKAKPKVRKMWNRAFFRTIRVGDGAIADQAYEEPFASLLGSHKGSMVEVGGRYSNQLDRLRRLLTGIR